MRTSLSCVSIHNCCIRHEIFQGNLFFLVQRKYRTKAETLPFTPVADRVDYVTAKNSTEILSDVSLLSVSGLHLTSVILYLMCFVYQPCQCRGWFVILCVDYGVFPALWGCYKAIISFCVLD